MGADAEVGLLGSVLEKDTGLLAALDGGRAGARTPCADFTVADLARHLVGYLSMFAAALEGGHQDPAEAAASSTDLAADFDAAGGRVMRSWRKDGTDRQITLVGDRPLPATFALDMLLVEYVGHGCDLALGSGQPVPFTDEELERTLTRARGILTPQFRGPGQQFGEEVPVDPAGPPLDRLLGFLGRDPAAWTG